MRVVIIEGDNVMASRLVQWIDERKEMIEVEHVLHSAADAIQYLTSNQQPDLIFLDTHLSSGKNFELFDVLNIRSQLIFTTTPEHFAAKVFKHISVDYLLKPIDKSELNELLDKWVLQRTPNNPAEYGGLMHESPVKTPYRSRFLVRNGMRMLSVETDKVAFAFTRERAQFIKTFDGEEYQIDINLNELEKQLSPVYFFRVNRQFIVHYPSIKHVFNWFDGKLKLELYPPTHEDIMISRLRAPIFKQWLGN